MIPPPDATLRMLLVWWGYRKRPLPRVMIFSPWRGPRLIRVNGPITVYDSTK